jgi:hypothetical protein
MLSIVIHKIEQRLAEMTTSVSIGTFDKPMAPMITPLAQRRKKWRSLVREIAEDADDWEKFSSRRARSSTTARFTQARRTPSITSATAEAGGPGMSILPDG